MLIYVNNIYCLAVAEKVEEMIKLRRFLTIQHPNLYQIQRQKPSLKYWDGKIKFLTSKNTFLTGLLEKVLTEFPEFEVIDERKHLYPIKDASYVLNDYTLREHQIEAVEAVKSKKLRNLRFTRGIINGATNLGKDGVIAVLHNSFQGKSLLLVHSMNLLQKSKEFFSKNLKCEIGFISQEGVKIEDFTIGMEKTVFNRYEEIHEELHQFDNLFVDECFAGDVQILTSSGFIKFKDLDRSYKVAQVTNELELDFTNDYELVFQENRETYTLDYRGFKLVCSPKHQFLFPELNAKVSLDRLHLYRGSKMSVSAYRLNDSDNSNSDLTAIYTAILNAANSKAFKVGKDEEDKLKLKLIMKHTVDFTLSVIRNRTTLHIDENNIIHVPKEIPPIDLSILSEETARELLVFVSTLVYISIKDRKLLLPYVEECTTILTYCAMITNNHLLVEKKTLYNGSIYVTYKLLKDYSITIYPNNKAKPNKEKSDLYCVRVPSGNIVVRAKNRVIVVGNCHRAGSDNYSKLITNIPAYNRILLSGTPLEGEDILRNIKILGLAGGEIIKVSNQELIDNNVSQKPIISIYKIEGLRANSYVEEYKNLKFNLERLTIIANYVKKTSKVLIAVNDIDHGDFIVNKLESLGKKIKFIHANSPDRFSALEDFESGDLDCLVSSLILKEGINLPSIRCLILALGGKSKITFKQLIGRALRNDGENSSVDIIDFYDNGKYLTKHSDMRIKTYENEGFEIQRKN